MIDLAETTVLTPDAQSRFDLQNVAMSDRFPEFRLGIMHLTPCEVSLFDMVLCQITTCVNELRSFFLAARGLRLRRAV
jgi:hypothetical protein